MAPRGAAPPRRGAGAAARGQGSKPAQQRKEVAKPRPAKLQRRAEPGSSEGDDGDVAPEHMDADQLRAWKRINANLDGDGASSSDDYDRDYEGQAAEGGGRRGVLAPRRDLAAAATDPAAGAARQRLMRPSSQPQEPAQTRLLKRQRRQAPEVETPSSSSGGGDDQGDDSDADDAAPEHMDADQLRAWKRINANLDEDGATSSEEEVEDASDADEGGGQRGGAAAAAPGAHGRGGPSGGGAAAAAAPQQRRALPSGPPAARRQAASEDSEEGDDEGDEGDEDGAQEGEEGGGSSSSEEGGGEGGSSEDEDERTLEEQVADVPFEVLEQLRGDGRGLVGPAARAAAAAADAASRSFKRANKDRPQEVSSKRPVGRFREVIQVPHREQRDPRFDSTAGPPPTDAFRRRYAFVYDDMLPREKAELVDKMKKEKNPKFKARLQAEVQRINGTLREEDLRRRTQVLESEWKTKERAAVASGKSPFFLKPADKKRLQLLAKFQELKERGKLDKFMEKRRKKNAAKDHRYLPSGRRQQGDDS